MKTEENTQIITAETQVITAEKDGILYVGVLNLDILSFSGVDKRGRHNCFFLDTDAYYNKSYIAFKNENAQTNRT